VEVVSARVRSLGILEKLPTSRARISRKQFAKPLKNVTAFIDGKKSNAIVYDRDDLRPGMKLRAPAIVTEYSSTTLIPPGTRVEVDTSGNLKIQVE